MHKKDDKYYNSSIPRAEFTGWVELDPVGVKELCVGDAILGPS